MKRWIFALAAIVGTGLPSTMSVVTAPPAAATYAGTWTPTLDQDFPDPSVLPLDGRVFAYSTGTVVENLLGAGSTDGIGFSATDDVMPELPAFARAGATWAPSVERAANGEFVMYYTAFNVEGADQCIGEATSKSPSGPFTDTHSAFMICQTGLGGSIDPQIFQDSGGTKYLLWKSDGNSIGVATHIWSEPLTANLVPTGARPSLLLSDDERFQHGIVEGPDMVQVRGRYYLFYGAGHFATKDYTIGWATCAGPMGPCVDHDKPLLQTSAGVSGPGGPDVFEYDGKRLMAFSGWAGTVGYSNGGFRALYIATVQFDPSGTPTLAPFNAGPVGYLLARRGGGAYSFGNAPDVGDLTVSSPRSPVVGTASSPDGRGYWLVTKDGGVASFGDATFHGSLVGRRLAKPIIGIAADPATGGYWLVASDGGVFAFDAPFHGSLAGRRLNQPVVGIAATSNGRGYWLVTKDGGVFAFGNARFLGSMGSTPLVKPIVGIAADPATGGYWLVASDGGVFTFDAPFHGSMGGIPLVRPVVGMAADPATGGYWLVASDGGVFTFDAPFLGSGAGPRPATPVVAIAATPPSATP